MKDLKPLTDLDLAVEYELASINLFGFSTYKHENRLSAARLRGELDAVVAELAARKLVGPGGGPIDTLAAQAQSDPRVVALAAQNQAHIANL